MVKHVLTTDKDTFISYSSEFDRWVRTDLIKETIPVFEVSGFDSISQQCEALGITLITKDNIINRDKKHYFVQYNHTTVLTPDFKIVRRLSYTEGRLLALSTKGIRPFQIYHCLQDNEFNICDCACTPSVEFQLLLGMSSSVSIHTLSVHWEHGIPHIDLKKSFITNSIRFSAIQISLSSNLLGRVEDTDNNEGEIVDHMTLEEEAKHPISFRPETTPITYTADLLSIALQTGHPLSSTVMPVSIIAWNIFSVGLYPYCTEIETLPSKELRYNDLFSFDLLPASKKEKGRMTGVFTTTDVFDGKHNQVSTFDIKGAYTHTLTMEITHFSRDSGIAAFWIQMQQLRSQMEATGNIQCARLIKYVSNAMSGRLMQKSSLASLFHDNTSAIFTALYWAVKAFVPTFLWKVFDLVKKEDPNFSYISMVTDGVIVQRKFAAVFETKFNNLCLSTGVHYKLDNDSGQHLLLLHANRFAVLTQTKQVIVKGFAEEKKNRLADLILRTVNCQCLKQQSEVLSVFCQCDLINGESFSHSERELVREFVTPKYHDEFLCVVEHTDSRITISCKLMGPVRYLYGPNLICPCGATLSPKFHQQIIQIASQSVATKFSRLFSILQ